MAILTSNGMKKILTRIMESGGLTEDMEKDIQRLKDDFDEREDILRKYGELYDGEGDVDDYDFIDVYTPDEEWKLEREGLEKERDDYKRKYEDMKSRYAERFVTGEPSTTGRTVIDNQEKDIKRDGEYQTFDELLTRVEG